MNPSITTIEQHSEQIGQLAAKAFLKEWKKKGFSGQSDYLGARINHP